MKYLFRITTLLTLAACFMYCGSNSTSPSTDSPTSSYKLALDTNSVLLSPVSISVPSGATLAIDSGTVVLLFDSTSGLKPVSAGSTVLIALDDGDAGRIVEIKGISMAARFQISATVNGTAAEMRFVPQAESGTLSMPVSGAHWSANLKDTAIHAGSRINLYRIGASGSYTLIGFQYVGIPTRVLAKMTADGSQQTTMNPDGTGSYQAGVDNGGSALPRPALVLD